MNWRPKLVALDIDGTLVDHDGSIPPQTSDAVGRIVDAGVRVVLSTGRGWHGTRPVFDALGLPPGPVVCSNGAVIVRYPPVEIVRTVTFDARDVLQRVAQVAPQALVAVEDVGRGYRVSEQWPPNELDGELLVTPWDELVPEPVSRVVIRDPNQTDADFIHLAEQLGLHGVSYTIGYSAWLDIAPEGVNKATALADICARLSIESADVLALGDGRNDIEMLSWAGRGVAVGDAPAEIQHAADYVTAPFADGGTAEELSRWF